MISRVAVDLWRLVVVILASQVMFGSWRTIWGCVNYGVSSPNAKRDGAVSNDSSRTVSSIKGQLHSHSIYRTELSPAAPVYIS